MTLNGDLHGVIETLERLYVQATATVQTHKSALAEAQNELTQIEKMLRLAGHDPRPEEPKPKSNKKQRHPAISDETRTAVLLGIRRLQEEGERMLPDAPGSFTAASLTAVTSLHETSVRNAIDVMRDEGLLRALGLDPASSSPRKPMVYSYVG